MFVPVRHIFAFLCKPSVHRFWDIPRSYPYQYVHPFLVCLCIILFSLPFFPSRLVLFCWSTFFWILPGLQTLVLIATFMFAAFSIGSALLYILTTLSSFYTFIAANEPPSAFVPRCVQSCNASPRCSGLYVLIRFLVICPSIQLLHLSFSANQLHILKGNWACIYFLYQNVSN